MLTTRRLEPADADTLADFVARIPPHDRTFFKADLASPASAGGLLSEPGLSAIAALEQDTIVGFVGSHRLAGWSDHVVELRLVVDPERRRQGVGTLLTREALRAAVVAGARKIVVEAAAQEEPTIALFEAHGFEPEALLRNQARDADGRFCDLIVLAHHVDDNLEALATIGVPDALTR